MSKNNLIQETPPGSKAAAAVGCTCPVMDNNYGDGIGRDADHKIMYWIADDCPVHKQVATKDT